MKIKRFQMGGAVAPEQGGAPMPAGGPEAGGAPMGPESGAPEGGEDPIMQLVQMAMQALQSQDPQMAMSVCDGLVQLVQGAGGGAPAPGGAPEEPVMMRKGGKMIAKKGAKMTKKRC